VEREFKFKQFLELQLIFLLIFKFHILSDYVQLFRLLFQQFVELRLYLVLLKLQELFFIYKLGLILFIVV
jgi:hypothetical protein